MMFLTEIYYLNVSHCKKKSNLLPSFTLSFPECELVALLEDDTGMELLVNNKIISLELPVEQVYKKIWCSGSNENKDPMKIVYRMRGLLGDATEDMIESLDSEKGKSFSGTTYFMKEGTDARLILKVALIQSKNILNLFSHLTVVFPRNRTSGANYSKLRFSEVSP